MTCWKTVTTDFCVIEDLVRCPLVATHLLVTAPRTLVSCDRELTAETELGVLAREPTSLPLCLQNRGTRFQWANCWPSLVPQK